MCPEGATCTLHTIYVCFNFHGLPIFVVLHFIFAVCDVIAQALPVWSTFSWDETLQIAIDSQKH